MPKMASLDRSRSDAGKLHISVIGTGYVGLVTAACLSDLGHRVTCVDIAEARIKQLNEGQLPIFEPGLKELVQRNVRKGRLSFTSDISHGIAGASAVFIAVGTPSQPNGSTNLDYVHTAVDQIVERLTGPCVVIIKSTVPVGTTRAIQQRINALNVTRDIVLASNPEFLREGSAVNDFMRPDRVVFGTESGTENQTLVKIYRPMFAGIPPFVFTDWQSSELTKCAANSFLALKIAFINEMSNICERVDADIGAVSAAVGMDTRIGSQYLNPGPGYGGACFPKDTKALAYMARSIGSPTSTVEAAIRSNDRRKILMVDKVIGACGGSVTGKTIAVLGLTFKPNTDDMREAPSLVVLPHLQRMGAQIQAYDPEGHVQAGELLAGVRFSTDSYAAMTGADAVVLLTDWDEFRSLDLQRAAAVVRGRVFVDLRNFCNPSKVKDAGFQYHSIGRRPGK